MQNVPTASLATARTRPWMAALAALAGIGGCRHLAVGDSTRYWADAYERQGEFVPYSAAAKDTTIQVQFERVVAVYPADASAVAESCVYLGTVGAGSAKKAKSVAARIGATHIVHLASRERLSAVLVSQSLAVPVYGVARSYAAYQCKTRALDR